MEQELLKLSPSSATDFKSCPQLFKFRSIDRLPEPTSALAARGILVHAVLERLFFEEPAGRTPECAERLLKCLWDELRSDAEFRPTGLNPAQGNSRPPRGAPRRVVDPHRLQDGPSAGGGPRADRLLRAALLRPGVLA